MLSNNGLVTHAKKALDEKWGYVWGTYGHVLTTLLLKEISLQYPKEVGKYTTFIVLNWINRRTVDCVGLIKSYLWGSDSVDPKYDPKTDITADEMYYKSEQRGTINSFPIRDLPGLLVWKNGHVGIYIGDGQVIEAHSTITGVIKTPLRGNGATEWTHWFKCSYITYNVDKFKTFEEIINESSDGQADAWIKAINTAVTIAEDDSNVGELEIFKFLPALIEKIGNKK